MTTTAAPSVHLDQAKLELDEYGYTTLRDQIPRDTALRMADRLMEIVERENPEEGGYRYLSCLYNFIEPSRMTSYSSPLITNPNVLSLVHDKLGDGYQIGGSNVVWRRPGVAASGLHSDVPLGWFAQQGLPVPENICFTVQCAWMLTDFTYENGATRLLPASHLMGIPSKWLDDDGNERFVDERSRLMRKELEMGDPNGRLVAAEGNAGTVLVFLGALWHQAGANSTPDHERVGVLTPYFTRLAHPKYGMGLHKSLLRRSVKDRMPDLVKDMCLRVLEEYEDEEEDD